MLAAYAAGFALEQLCTLLHHADLLLQGINGGLKLAPRRSREHFLGVVFVCVCVWGGGQQRRKEGNKSSSTKTHLEFVFVGCLKFVHKQLEVFFALAQPLLSKPRLVSLQLELRLQLLSRG